MYRSREVPPRKLALAAQMRVEPTEGERLLGDALRGRRRTSRWPLRIHRQQVILGYIVDVYMPTWRAIVEIDGGVHGTDDQAAWDAQRDRAFGTADYSVFRVDDALVRRDSDMVAELVEWYADSIDFLRREGGPWGRSSRASLTWSFRGRGILRRGGEYGTPRERLHVFRFGAGFPADYPIELGCDVGEIDYHDIDACRDARCVELESGAR